MGTDVNSTVNRLLGRRRRARPEHIPDSQNAERIRNAIVEVFERREIAGWVEVDPNAGPVPIDLCVNGEAVATTWAAPKPGRRVRGRLLQFRFGVNDLWKFTKRTDKVTVEVAGSPIPIVNKGTYYHPRRDGQESLRTLRKYLTEGYVFGQTGRLQISKAMDQQWQEAVLGLYKRVNSVLSDSFDLQAFLCYGSLLGVIRDNGFIGHDLDFDSAYVSRQKSGPAAAQELAEISLELIERGFNVVPKRTCLAIKDELSENVKIDLYHLYYDESGNLSFPFGIAGDPDKSRNVSTNPRTVNLSGHDVFVPEDAEQIVEITYGANWRTPNPGFRWQNDRTTSAREGIVPIEQVDEITRANVTPSQVDQRQVMDSVLVSGRDITDIVVEVGSSLGDQAAVIAAAGKRVIGLERTMMSVKRAQRYVDSQGLADQVEFRPVDIYDPEQLEAAIRDIRREVGGGNLTFYTRSFPAFSDLLLRSLLSSVNNCVFSDDYLITDFRTAPADRWPKDKNPAAPPKWTAQTFYTQLDTKAWSAEFAGPDEAGNDQAERQTGVVIARYR